MDINIVRNDKLDIEAFKAWRPEFADAEFILEDGEYIDRISGGKTEVLRGMTRCQGEPVILFSSDRQSAVKNA